MKWLPRVLKDPLVAFLGCGAVLAGLYVGLIAPASAGEDERVIHVDEGTIRWISGSYEKQLMRKPTPRELEGLIEGYVRETVLYREALAMGLDAEDTIVRRRLAQKLEFLTQDVAGLVVPSEEELKDFHSRNGEKYGEPGFVTLTHVYFSPDERGESAEGDARALLARLEGQGTENAARLGDRFMLQRYYPENSLEEIGRLFGRGFAAAIGKLETGRWQGPVESGYGWHLVYVHARTEPSTPAFEAVRDRVKEDWMAAKRKELTDRLYARLRERYEVIVDPYEAPR